MGVFFSKGEKKVLLPWNDDTFYTVLFTLFSSVSKGEPDRSEWGKENQEVFDSSYTTLPAGMCHVVVCPQWGEASLPPSEEEEENDSLFIASCRLSWAGVLAAGRAESCMGGSQQPFWKAGFVPSFVRSFVRVFTSCKNAIESLLPSTKKEELHENERL